MPLEDNCILSSAQMRTRAARTKVWKDSAAKVRSEWKEGDRFTLPATGTGLNGHPPVAGRFVMVKARHNGPMPYVVMYFRAGDGREAYVSTTRFARDVVRVEEGE